MKTEFELLIEELEIQKECLRKELQECLEFQDYKYAHYYQKGIWRIETKIEKLKTLNRAPLNPDTQYLTDAIVELKEGKIRAFSLFFVGKSDFYLHFYRTSNGILYCQFPSEIEMLKSYYYTYEPETRKAISFLGFQIGPEKSGIEFEVERDNSCNFILTKLAILMFEILRVRTDVNGYIKKESGAF